MRYSNTAQDMNNPALLVYHHQRNWRSNTGLTPLLTPAEALGAFQPKLGVADDSDIARGGAMLTNSRGSLAERARRKNKDNLMFLFAANKPDAPFRGMDDDPYGRRPRARRMGRGKRGNADSERKPRNTDADADGKPRNTDADADGKPRNTDAEKPKSPDAASQRHTKIPDAESQHAPSSPGDESDRARVAEPGSSTRVEDVNNNPRGGIADDIHHRGFGQGVETPQSPDAPRGDAPPGRPPRSPAELLGDPVVPDTPRPLDTTHTPRPATGAGRAGVEIVDDIGGRGFGSGVEAPQSPGAPRGDAPPGRLVQQPLGSLASGSPDVLPDLPARSGATPSVEDFLAGNNRILVDTETPTLRHAANPAEAPNLDNVRIVSPTTGAPETPRELPHLFTPVADNIDAAPARMENPPARLSLWDTHLSSRGTTVEDFNRAVREPPAALRQDIALRAVADTPHARITAARTLRVARIASPTLLDGAIIVGAAGIGFTSVALITYSTSGEIDYAQAGKQAFNMGADVTPVLDAVVAKMRGDHDEAWIRGWVNVVEIGSGIGFVVGGAAAGAAIGSTVPGVGTIAGGVIGGLVGAVGAVGVSIATDELLRSYGRANGWDVDRGFISSWFAPQYADQMEAWFKELNANGANIPDDATPQQVIDGISDVTDDPIERLEIFKALMTTMNDGLYAQQQEKLQSIEEIVATHTNGEIADIDAIRAVLDGPASARAHFISFYESRLQENPDDIGASMVMDVVQEYYALQGQREITQSAMLNADAVRAFDLNNEIRNQATGFLMQIHPDYSIYGQEIPELAEINAAENLLHLVNYIEHQEALNGDNETFIPAIMASNGDVYLAAGSYQMMSEMHLFLENAETALEAALDRIISPHLDKFEIFFENYDRMEHSIHQAMEDYEESDPEAVAQLESIIAESNNFQNLTEEQKLALARNPVFMEAMALSGNKPPYMNRAWFWQDNPNSDLRAAHHDIMIELGAHFMMSEYTRVRQLQDTVRYQKGVLDETTRRHGLVIDSSPDELSPEHSLETQAALEAQSREQELALHHQ